MRTLALCCGFLDYSSQCKADDIVPGNVLCFLKIVNSKYRFLSWGEEGVNELDR